MIYIGIDIAKDNFVASALETPQKLLFYGKSYPNCQSGFADFLFSLINQGLTEQETVVVLESTGVYGEQLCYFLHKQTFTVCVEPAQYVRRAFRLKRKTDKVDSKMIAEYGYRYRDQLHPWQPRNELIEQFQTLLVNRELFIKERTAHKNIMKALKHKQNLSLVHYHQETIDFLKGQIKAIDEQLIILVAKESDSEIQNHFMNLMTLPGVGMLWAANFFVISNGFHNLNYRSLASYLGIVPHEYESGSSVYRKPRTDKTAPDMMRKLLYLSAISIIRLDGPFKAYYQRKKAEGKNGKLILNNIANKQLKIACAIVRDRRPYIKSYRSLNPILF